MCSGLLGEKLQEISAVICHFYGNLKLKFGTELFEAEFEKGHIILGRTIPVILKRSRNTDCNSYKDFCHCGLFIFIDPCLQP